MGVRGWNHCDNEQRCYRCAERQAGRVRSHESVPRWECECREYWRRETLCQVNSGALCIGRRRRSRGSKHDFEKKNCIRAHIHRTMRRLPVVASSKARRLLARGIRHQSQVEGSSIVWRVWRSHLPAVRDLRAELQSLHGEIDAIDEDAIEAPPFREEIKMRRDGRIQNYRVARGHVGTPGETAVPDSRHTKRNWWSNQSLKLEVLY